MLYEVITPKLRGQDPLPAGITLAAPGNRHSSGLVIHGTYRHYATFRPQPASLPDQAA